MSAQLTALNRELHAGLEARLTAFLEAITALELEAARARWRGFVLALGAHAAAEEAHVFPRCSALAVAANGSAAIAERDHRLIDRAMERVDSLLEALCAAPASARRELLARSLAPLVRLQSVLAHHVEREDSLLYPAIDRTLPEAVRARMAQALCEARG